MPLSLTIFSVFSHRDNEAALVWRFFRLVNRG
jgi:hypothetical protein